MSIEYDDQGQFLDHDQDLGYDQFQVDNQDKDEDKDENPVQADSHQEQSLLPAARAGCPEVAPGHGASN